MNTQKKFKLIVFWIISFSQPLMIISMENQKKIILEQCWKGHQEDVLLYVAMSHMANESIPYKRDNQEKALFNGQEGCVITYLDNGENISSLFDEMLALFNHKRFDDEVCILAHIQTMRNDEKEVGCTDFLHSKKRKKAFCLIS